MYKKNIRFALYTDKLRHIADLYDVFLCDLWGVLYEGDEIIFDKALKAIRKIRARQKKIIFISNSPNKNIDCVDYLNNIGVKSDLFDYALTAGDEAINFLLKKKEFFGKKVYVIDTNFWHKNKQLDSLYQRVDNIDDSDLLFTLAIPKNIKDPSFYLSILEVARKKNIPLVNFNDDIYAKQADIFHLRPGILAKKYREMGGKVYGFGKPEKEFFKKALNLFPQINKSKFIMIGDTEQTDIIGAKKVGISSLLITNSYGLPKIYNGATYFMPKLIW
jgi:HAD superfamily hydrolase (TIGR01459 family)